MPASSTRKKCKLKEAGVPDRPEKYKQWSNDSMLGAMKAVSEGMGINRAALEFGVPRSTLKDRVSGRVSHGAKSGRAPYRSW